MARVEIAPEVGDDLDRIFDYLAKHDADGAPARIREIIQAISVLESNPLIGRPARRNMRELIMGRPSRGYVALYRYVPEIDTVFVLALRSQREAGYKTAPD
jgi:plasmid stabilization system protein ParE